MWDILGLIIGIVFAYLLLSLLATIIQEIVASVLSMRGKFLLGAMVQLLELDWVDESELAGTPEGQKIKALQAKRKEKRQEWVNNIKGTRVYQKYMHKSGWVNSLPSYLSAEQVIAILQELMVEEPEQKVDGGGGDRIETEGVGELRGRGAGRIITSGIQQPGDQPTDASGAGPEITRAAGLNQIKPVTAKKPKMLESMKHMRLQENLNKLNQLSKAQVNAAEAPEVDKISRSLNLPGSVGEKVEEFEERVSEKFNQIKQEISTDFNEMMDRTSGWYKKRTQLVLFIIGMIIAVSFDADTFDMYRALSNNPEAQREVLALADRFVAAESPENFATQAGANAEEQLLELRKKANLLLADEIDGLNSALGFGRASFPEKVPAAEAGTPVTMKQVIFFRGSKFFGWLVTALAISLGSTFWFDILKQLINIRNAGVKPGGTR